MSAERAVHDGKERPTAMITDKLAPGVGYSVFFDENDVFKRCVVTWIDPEDYAWVGVSKTKRTHELTLDDLRVLLHRVDDEKAYLAMSPEFTCVTKIDPEKHFIKRPPISLFDESDPLNSLRTLNVMKGELKILEQLRTKPHPNVVPYYGCLVKRGYVVGIVLERFHSILDGRFDVDGSSLDITRLEEGLNAAVAHLHALGLAHNDIKPDNIALDADENPVLLDLGSSAPFDEHLISSGTQGWIDDDFVNISRPAHDLSAVKKVVAWAIEEKAKQAAKNGADSAPAA